MGKGQTFKPRVHKTSKLGTLTGTNYSQFFRKFKDTAGLYGTAGREIITGEPMDFTPRVRTRHFKDEHMTDTGRRVVILKRWNKRAQRLLEAENRSLADKQKEHEKHQGVLWNDLIDSIHPALLEALKVRKRVEFEKAQEKLDTFALFGMLKVLVEGILRVRRALMQITVDQLHQGKMTFTKFLNEFEDHVENLRLAGEQMTDSEKACKLRDKVNLNWGPLACPEAFNKSETDPAFPTYLQLRDALTVYDTNMSSISLNMGNRETDRDTQPNRNQDRNGKGKEGRKKEKKAEAGEDQGQVLSLKQMLVDFAGEIRKEFANSLKVGNGGSQDKKSKFDDNKGKNKFPCWNCGQTGHRYFKCPKEACCST